MKLSIIARMVQTQFAPTSRIIAKNNNIKSKSLNLIKPISIGLLSTALFGLPTSPLLAATIDTCTVQSNCIVVSDQTQLQTALNNASTGTRILLANDITLTSNINVVMDSTNRKNIIIDGNGKTLDTNKSRFEVSTLSPSTWTSENGSFTFENFQELKANKAGDMRVIDVTQNSPINVVFDNINKFSDSMYAVMGVLGDSGRGNQIAEVVFGNIYGMDKFTYGSGHQIVQGGPLRFKGVFDIFTDGSAGTYNTVFWSNVSNEFNTMTFEKDAKVSAQVTYFTLGNNVNNNAYKYIMEDGASFKLYTRQNVFGQVNNGLKLGSYDALNGFGEGVLLDLADYGGNPLAGHSISNLSADVTGGLGNGATKAGDVVFNIKAGSKLNYSGANNAGIFVQKNNTVGGNVYVRSDATLNATNANGIMTTMNGTGDLVLLNDKNAVINAQTGIGLNSVTGQGKYAISQQGIINSTVNGLDINTASNANIDMQDGVINANAGNGLKTAGKGHVSLSGGTINITNAANGLAIGSTGNTTIDNLNLNIVDGTGTAVTQSSNGPLSITNSLFTANNFASIFKNITAIKLDNVDLTTQGNAVGITATANELNSWNINDLTLNLRDTSSGIVLSGGMNINKDITINMADNATGVGLQLKDGTTTQTTINDGFKFNNANKTALQISGNQDKTVLQQTGVTGNILIDNEQSTTYSLANQLTGNISATAGTAHIINLLNDAIFNGNIELATGNNTINIAENSQSIGSIIGSLAADSVRLASNSHSDLLIDLKAGNNSVTLENGSTLNNSVMSGSGDDVLVVNNATLTGDTNLGDGQNLVQLNGLVNIANITTGAGNDTFELTDLDVNSIIGQIQAGLGNNKLTLSTLNNGEFILDEKNKWTGMTTADILAQSVLTLNSLTAAENTRFVLSDTSTLNIHPNNTVTADFVNTVAGTGRVNVAGHINLVADQSDFSGLWQINQAGIINTSLTNAFGLGRIQNDGLINFDNINRFNNQTTGTGTFTINNAKDLTFDNQFGSDFAGKFVITSSNLLLDANNANALSKAELVLGDGTLASITTNQTIGDLTLNGGKLDFTLMNPTVAPVLKTGHLNVDSLKRAVIDLAGQINLDLTKIPVGAPALNFLDQDSMLSNNAIQLISADSISIGDKHIDLTVNNQQLSDGVLIENLSDGFGNLVSGIYKYTAISAKDALNSLGAGLYIDFLLSELQTSGNLVFENSTSTNNSIDALISGAGGIEIQGKADTPITLTNENNSYSGRTQVTTGQLNLGGDNVLGQTSELAIAKDALVDMLNANIHLASLSGEGVMNISNGALTLNNGTFSGNITGAQTGQFTVADGNVTLIGDNQFTGQTTVNADGILNIGNGDTIGTFVGNILNNGELNFNKSSDATYAGVVSGQGTLNKLGSGNLTLTQAQTSSGLTTIDAGTLTLGQNGTLLSDILNNAILAIDKTGDLTLTQTISGNGQVNLIGQGSTTLSASNTYSGGTNIQAGELILTQADAAGTGIIDNNGLLTLSFSNTSFGNALSGNGVVNIDGQNITLNADNTDFSGQIKIDTPASLNVNSQNQLGLANIALNGRLDFTTAVETTWTNALSGTGLFNVTSNGNEFKFNPINNADLFAGTLALNNASFTIDDANNLAALNKATLSLRNGSSATSSAEVGLNHLDIQGGQLNIQMKDATSANILAVNKLSLDNQFGQGVLNLLGASLDTLAPKESKSILDQNTIDASTGFLVVKANEVATPGQMLSLKIDGILQEGVTSGTFDDASNQIKATYNYMGVAADNSIDKDITQNGLYVTYVLSELETLTDLVIDASKSNFNQLLAKVTGTGNLVLKSNGTQPIVINNGLNDYQGSTTIENGVVKLGADQSLSSVGDLNVINQGTLDLAGKTQDTTGLQIDNTATLNFNEGTLNYKGSSKPAEINGQLNGAGHLNIQAGNFIVNSVNDLLEASIKVVANAVLQLNNNATMGNGDLILEENAALTLNQSNSLVKNNLSGTGEVNLINSEATLGGNSVDFKGTFAVDAESLLTVKDLTNIGLAKINNLGALNLDLTGLDQTLTADISGPGQINKLGDGVLRIKQNYNQIGDIHTQAGYVLLEDTQAQINGLNIDENAFAGGFGTINGTVTNEGVLFVGDATNLIKETTQTLNITGDLHNYNIVSLAGKKAGNVLNVAGNYDARSDLIFNTVLSDDNSVTDKLNIQGNTAGHTTVYVNNMGGKGAQTEKGIELITVEGDSTGSFALGNRLVAGGYDYELIQQGTNWFLQSNLLAIRPEIGAYLANIDIANAANSMSYQDRTSNSLLNIAGAKSATARSHDGRVWGKVVGGVTDSRAAGEIDQRLYSSYMQLGSDLIALENETSNHNLTLGVMGAIGSAHSSNTNDLSGFVANSKQDNYRVGAYGTFLFDGLSDKNQSYIDSWVQYGWYNNEISGQGLAQDENYHANSLAASVEFGLPVTIFKDTEQSFDLIPQAQLTYKHLTADNFTEQNGTEITHPTVSGLESRIGTQVVYQNSRLNNPGLKSYLGINWIHDNARSEVKLNEVSYHSNKPADILDTHVGLELNYSKGLSSFIEVGSQQGSNNYNNIQGTFGLSYKF